jgi:hypothetical protein
MAGLLDELRGGTRKTLGRSKAVAQRILADPSLLDELLEAFESNDKVLLSRAADCLEAVAAARPELVQPHKALILGWLTQFEQWEVREHTCLLISHLRLTGAERREMFDTVRGWLSDKSSIVRTFSMQTMFDLSRQDASLAEDVADVLEQALVHGTPAMKARARNLLKGRR